MNVVVNYEDNRWNKYKIDFDKIAYAAAGPMHNDSEVSVILTNDSKIRMLNKKYRGLDKPTNVLSFETGDPELLGDIFISFDTVMKQATEEGKTFQDHAAHMVVHGVLHLMGYDHIDDKDAEKMERIEVEILAKLKIDDPYAVKVSPAPRVCVWWQSALYFVFGAAASFGYAPFNLWWATLIGIGGAYFLAIRDSDSGRRNYFWKSALQMAPFGAAYAIGMFWWVVNSIFVVPELARQFAIWTAPAILGIGLVGGIIFTAPIVAIRCIRTNRAYTAILFALFWTVVLWLREWLLTGFPWNPVANISMPFPMIANSMSLWGALGLTFVITGLVAAAVELIRNRKSKGVRAQFIVFAALMAVGMLAGYRNIKASANAPDNDALVVRIVQPARSAEEKATHSREQAIENAEKNIRNLLRLATENPAKADLYIFPETSYPYTVTGGDMPIAAVLDADVIIGATTYKEGRFYNSMLIANQDGRIEKIYSKSHLVPFGEYRPLGDIIPTPGQLTPGDGPEILRVGASGREINFAPAICYEIIFSDSLIPSGSGAAPRAIVNITNDTWFGKTPGTYQHLGMVRRYAIESGMPIVRSNYSGISAFVNADGTIASFLPIGAAGHLDGQIGTGHVTVYRKIGRDFWMLIILLFSAVCAKSISVFQKKD
jgi:apolipoprotein N-acyltransferase